jgi:hypothetical protein
VSFSNGQAIVDGAVADDPILKTFS